MQKPEHPQQYLMQGYLGEIRGEETFRVFIDKLPDRRASLELLAEVERATAAFLKGHLEAEASPVDVEQARDQARARLENFAVDSWQDFISASKPIVEQALAIMKQAHDYAPRDLLAVYETFTAHEQALLDYLELEQRGENGDQVLKEYLALVAV
ncbi:MAG: hypothetical protein VYE04_04585 [Pseudomonadota bacterium]|nr:hypothetical protein [Pseudomonadota bacterium]